MKICNPDPAVPTLEQTCILGRFAPDSLLNFLHAPQTNSFPLSGRRESTWKELLLPDCPGESPRHLSLTHAYPLILVTVCVRTLPRVRMSSQKVLSLRRCIARATYSIGDSIFSPPARLSSYGDTFSFYLLPLLLWFPLAYQPFCLADLFGGHLGSNNTSV